MKKVLCVVVLHALIGCVTTQSDGGGKNLTCAQHASAAMLLNEWAAKNFSEIYGRSGDAKGAEAQLFLIEQNAPSPYAVAFIRYQKKAIENVVLAKKKGCDTSGYPAPPVDEFKVRLETLKGRGIDVH
ncbi:hypothetical protein [Burkholderia sp. F1]|uniref:hypothetical protein n=1 Tax=Burkholderia sp. F1 TaxID=3366817 RepID=UPI003D7616B3